MQKLRQEGQRRRGGEKNKEVEIIPFKHPELSIVRISVITGFMEVSQESWQKAQRRKCQGGAKPAESNHSNQVSVLSPRPILVNIIRLLVYYKWIQLRNRQMEETQRANM
ncbi:uncharacterized protein LOC144291858 isoform X1 [Canis aureus]